MQEVSSFYIYYDPFRNEARKYGFTVGFQVILRRLEALRNL